jgi:hypothetical protein
MAKKKTNLTNAEIQKEFIKIYSEEEFNQIVSSDEAALKKYHAECEANKIRTYTEVYNHAEWLRGDELIEQGKEIQKPFKDALKEMDDRQSIKALLCLKLLHKKSCVNLGIIEDTSEA